MIMIIQANLDMTDSMALGKLLRHMRNPSYSYDTYLIRMGLGPSISSVIGKSPSYSGPSYPSSPVIIIMIIMVVIMMMMVIIIMIIMRMTIIMMINSYTKDDDRDFGGDLHLFSGDEIFLCYDDESDNDNF